MPVKPFGKAPADDQVIWRYMDLRKFRDLMSNQEIYLRRADLFADKTEGMPMMTYATEVLGYNQYDVLHNEELRGLYGTMAQQREMYYLTCWHIFETESKDMWAKYGHDGVAIVSTYGRLKETLADLIDEVDVGVIQYGTAHLGRNFNVFEHITTKQQMYAFEQELRVIITVPDMVAGINRHFSLDNRVMAEPLSVNPRHSWVQDGTKRRIHIEKLISEVVISPWAADYVAEEIRTFATVKKLPPPRYESLRSDLLRVSAKDYIAGRKAVGAWFEEPKEPAPAPATPVECKALYDLDSTVDLARAEFLYRARWDACELKPGSLPLQANIQYLEMNWKVLDDFRKKREEEAERETK